MKKSVKNILLFGGISACFLLIFFIISKYFPANKIIKEAEAANTITCSLDPFAVKPGETVTIIADVNFVASDVWAMIEGNDGVAQTHYSLVESPANHWEKTYTSASTATGLYDMAIYATVDGTGEQILCNPSAGSSWIKKTLSSMPWHSRFSHEILSYGGYLWILGGYTNNYDNDVWRSQDGETWDLITADAPWAGRKSFGSAVFDPDGAGPLLEAMYIFGGDNYVGSTHTFYHDVWTSTNGKDWTPLSNANWSAREYFATAVYDGKIWISGGYDGAYKADLWYTSNPSAGWTQVTLSTGFNTLAKHQMVAYDDGDGERLWILGGQNLDTPPVYEKNNVWKANADGTVWTLQSAPPWAARYEFSAVVYNYLSDNPDKGKKILVMGGADNSDIGLNDVWSYTKDEGWDLVTDPDPADHYPAGSEPSTWTNWSSRFRLRTVVHNPGSGDELFLIGGREITNRTWNDVWTTTDGANWDLIGDHYDGLFGNRWAGSLAAYDGGDGEKLWIIGPGNDIWSSPDGVTWVQDVATADWPARWAHKTLLYNNKLWLIGGCKPGSGGGGIMCGGICSGTGTDGLNKKACIKGSDCGTDSTCVYAGLNDVWSTTDGTTWTEEAANANFMGRYEFATAVFDDGSGEKMWILGGDVSGKCAGGTYSGEICRANADCPSSTCSKVCVAGSSIGTTCTDASTCGGVGVGNCSFYALNDVLSSADGITWNLETAVGQWSTRSSFVALGYNDKLWVMAGFHTTTGVLSGSYLNDVWSSTDGTTWTQATNHAAWNPRHTPALVEFQNKMWVFGGNNGFFSDQLWSRMDSNNVYWSTDGATWNQATDWAEWDGRDFFSYTVFQDRMWLMGGDSMGTGNNDVWASRYGDMTYYVVPQKSGQVNITAQVEPDISLSLSSNLCDLGVLSATNLKTCGLVTTVSTNAVNGYSEFIKQNHAFQSTNGAVTTIITGPDSNDVIDGTDPLSGDYGEYGIGIQTEDTTTWNEFSGDCNSYLNNTTDLPAKAIQDLVADDTDALLAYNASPVDGTTYGKVSLCAGVRIKYNTPPGYYSHTLTLTVVGNF